MTNLLASQQPAPILEDPDVKFFDDMTADKLAQMRAHTRRLEDAVRLALCENETTRCGLREQVCGVLRAALSTPLGTPGRDKP